MTRSAAIVFVSAALAANSLAQLSAPISPKAKQAPDQLTSNSPVRDMHRASTSEGWALVGQRVLWTNSAGQVWTDITPPLAANQTIDSAYFLDTGHGWTLVRASNDDMAVTGITIAATEDGGKTWSSNNLPSDAYLLEGYAGGSFSFVDAARGWMLAGIAAGSAASRAELFATVDGGKTWTALPKPPVSGEIQMLSALSGWLRGGIGDGDLYRTRDGGQTWSRSAVTLPEGVQPYSDPQYGPTFKMRPVYQQLFFKNPQDGVLVVSVQVTMTSFTLLTYQTEDGGESWQLKRVEPGLASTWKIAAFDSSFVKVAFQAGVLSLQQNSSSLAVKLPQGIPPAQAVRKADFLDAEHGWVLLRDGYCSSPGCGNSVLIGTEDGQTFSTLLKSTGTSRTPIASASNIAVEPDIGGATGANAQGIDTWQPVPPVYANSFYGPHWSNFAGSRSPLILLAPPTFAFIVFAGIAPAQSLTAAVNELPDDPIASMHLLTASSGYVWRLKHILWTHNAGQNWNDITPPLEPNQVIGGLSFLDGDHGWALLKDSGIGTPDDSGTSNSLLVSVAATADGGKSWSVVPVPDNGPLQYTGGAPIFVDDTRGWLFLNIQGSSAFSGGKLFSTKNAGATWSALPQPPISGSLQFFPDGTGWLCGGVHSDELYRSRDGGFTWTQKVIALPTSVQPYTIPDGSKTGIYRMHPTYMGPHFSTEQQGIILISVPVSEQKTTLLSYTTEDGGDTWQLQKIGSKAGQGLVGRPAFFDSTYIEVGSVEGTSGTASFRLDSEETAQAVVTRLPNKSSIVNHADFTDRLHGWLLMSDGSLLGTSDGGKTLIVLMKSGQRQPL